MQDFFTQPCTARHANAAAHEREREATHIKDNMKTTFKGPHSTFRYGEYSCHLTGLTNSFPQTQDLPTCLSQLQMRCLVKVTAIRVTISYSDCNSNIDKVIIS